MRHFHPSSRIFPTQNTHHLKRMLFIFMKNVLLLELKLRGVKSLSNTFYRSWSVLQFIGKQYEIPFWGHFTSMIQIGNAQEERKIMYSLSPREKKTVHAKNNLFIFDGPPDQKMIISSTIPFFYYLFISLFNIHFFSFSIIIIIYAISRKYCKKRVE